jgi:hypothetical protein
MTIPAPSDTVWNVVALNYDLPLGTTPPNGQVTAIHWTAVLTEIVPSGSEAKSVNSYGMVELGAPDPGSYTPYSKITDAQSVEWAQAALGQQEKDNIEAGLVEALRLAITPTTAVGVPWATTMEIKPEDITTADISSEDSNTADRI